MGTYPAWAHQATSFTGCRYSVRSERWSASKVPVHGVHYLAEGDRSRDDGRGDEGGGHGGHRGDLDGERCGSRRTSPGTYRTIFGPVEIERSVYQLAGRGRLRIPMDARLGIIEGGYTSKLARVLTHGIAVMTEEDAAGFVEEVGLATVSSSTSNRIPRAIAVIEAAIREQDEIPARAVTVQAGIDGVMVPQDGEHAMPRGRKTDSPNPPRHGVIGNGPAEHDGNDGMRVARSIGGHAGLLQRRGRSTQDDLRRADAGASQGDDGRDPGARTARGATRATRAQHHIRQRWCGRTVGGAGARLPLSKQSSYRK